uniref:DNA-directed RNA polymerase subunit n=1 Tax=Leucocytozoon caulleryi TaxID=211597 RepID=U3TRU6_LEUCU|nr:DNA-directed RNA polymerase subunit C1 [Leucocytozoon caulleryi]BAN94691.1 DNA-directed RNA polymerase subunit C1 [Leucocytozoon caulleryi]
MIITNNINFIGLKLNILNPKQIIKWSSNIYKNKIIIGEVLTPETINFNTGLPILNGLFCEKIFDYIYTWNCNCNTQIYNINKFNFNLYCKFCKSKLKSNINRKYKLGFIFLNIPILHLWYLIGPLKIASLLLNKTNYYLKFLIYYKYFFNNIKYKKYLNYNKLLSYYTYNIYKKYNIIQLLFAHNILYTKLKYLNLLTELLYNKELLLLHSKNKKNIYKKINLLHLLIINNIKPNWIFLDLLPILPAGLRPYFYLNNNTYVISIINENYKLIILRNNRLKYWLYLRNNIFFIFEIIEKRLLQQLIDYLLHNKLILKNNNMFFTFNKIFKGKYSIIKYNLLGKRVDFSGRSVITVSPNILFNNIGLPYYISLNLFKPFLINILKYNKKLNIIFKSVLINKNYFIIKKFLNILLQTQFILINRAPTLHRMNLQSFRPILTEGYSIKFYPLGCKSFNADFDGDQMSIFIPLIKTTKFESNINLNFDKNVISPLNNSNLFKNLQYFKVGLYTLLNLYYIKLNYCYYFNYIESVYEMYNNNLLNLFDLVWIKYIYNNNIFYILTTVNRIILNFYIYIY